MIEQEATLAVARFGSPGRFPLSDYVTDRFHWVNALAQSALVVLVFPLFSEWNRWWLLLSVPLGALLFWGVWRQCRTLWAIEEKILQSSETKPICAPD